MTAPPRTRPSPRYRLRYASMLLAVFALLAALWAGLVRIGVDLPALRSGLAALHGPLLVLGFLGTLIALERAVAVGRLWAYAAPAASGLGALLLAVDLPEEPGQALQLAGGLALVAIFVSLARIQLTFHLAVLILGAALWPVGSALWLAGRPLADVVPWWAGFLVLTIAGERLELARLMRLTSVDRVLFAIALAVFSCGLAVSAGALDEGSRVAGAGLLGLTAWLARHDVVRRTVRSPGLPRYVAVALGGGYVWLAVAGALWLRFGGVLAGPHRDALLHALLVGFVMSMVFGHAPMIFPAVLGLTMPFSRLLYGPLALLHLGLAARVAGDLGSAPDVARWSAAANAAAILLFLAAVAGTAIRARLVARRI